MLKSALIINHNVYFTTTDPAMNNELCHFCCYGNDKASMHGNQWMLQYQQLKCECRAANNSVSIRSNVFYSPNSSTVVSASFGRASSDFLHSHFGHPPNMVTCVRPGPKLKAVTVCDSRGCAPLGRVTLS